VYHQQRLLDSSCEWLRAQTLESHADALHDPSFRERKDLLAHAERSEPLPKEALFGQNGGGEKRLKFARLSGLRGNREPRSPMWEL
jgi:hypothetical protein